MKIYTLFISDTYEDDERQWYFASKSEAEKQAVASMLDSIKYFDTFQSMSMLNDAEEINSLIKKGSYSEAIEFWNKHHAFSNGMIISIFEMDTDEFVAEEPEILDEEFFDEYRKQFEQKVN